MPKEDFCEQIEAGMKNLLDQGRTNVKAHEIAEETDITKEDFQSPSQHIGWNLGFGFCGELEHVGWEIVQNESGANNYKLFYK